MARIHLCKKLENTQCAGFQVCPAKLGVDQMLGLTSNVNGVSLPEPASSLELFHHDVALRPAVSYVLIELPAKLS